MQYNECKVCGANEGRAGLLISSPTEGYESACENCRDSLTSGNMVVHANLRRTPAELDRMMAAVTLRHAPAKPVVEVVKASSGVVDCGRHAIEEGDIVATNRSGYTMSLVLATVIGFTKQKVRLQYLSKPDADPTLKFPEQVCFVRHPK